MKFRETKLKSISDLIKAPMLIIVLVAFAVVSVLFVMTEYASVSRIVHNTVESESAVTTDRIEWAIKSYKNIAEDIGTISDLSNPKVSVRKKTEILDAKSKEYGLVRCKTINPDGYSDMDHEYRGDREYFKQALQGETVISNPIIAKTDGNLALIVAAPLWKDGVYGSEVCGVVFCAIDPSLLSSIVSEVVTTKNTTIRVINADGDLVASQNLDDVRNSVNYIQRAESDVYYETYAKVDRAAVRGESGIITEWRGIYEDISAINEIEGTPEWKLIINVPLKDYLNTFGIALLLFVVLLAVMYLIISKKSEKIADNIGAPFKEIAERLRKAAEGDLSTEVLTFGDTEEIKTISVAARDLVKRLDFMVMDDEEFDSSTAIRNLIDEQTLKSFQEIIKKSVGVGIVITDPEGESVITPIDSCSFCEDYIKKSLRGHERCYQCDRQATMKCLEQGSCISYECHMGNREYVAPIMLEGHFLGVIIGGQIRTKETPDEEFLIKQAEELGLDKEGLLEAYGQMKIWSKEDVDKAEEVINITAEHLSNMARRNYRQNIRNRKQEKRAVLRSVKNGISDNSIPSLMKNISGLDTLKLLNPDANGVMRKLAVIDDDEQHLSECSYNVRETITDAIGDMDTRTKGKHIDFLVDIKNELPKMLMGDQNKVSNIVNRMIQTAVSSTDFGYIRMDVSGVKSGYALFLKMKVRYSGGNREAIDANHMRRFFDQKNSFSVENHSSQEIGLITLGNVIRDVNGQIDIKENQGHGITMSVVIPQLEALEET